MKLQINNCLCFNNRSFCKKYRYENNKTFKYSTSHFTS